MPERRPDEKAHDVLAAEAFVMPAPDPALRRDQAHDVLAAEEFVLPGRDPALHHGPVTLPDDPSGIVGAHDVLAAEEFALPAGRPPVTGLPAAGAPAVGRRRMLLALGGVVCAALLRRSRRS